MSGPSHSPSVCFSGLDEVHVSTIHLAAKMLEPTTDWSIGVPQGIIQPYKWKATEVIKPRDSSSREAEKTYTQTQSLLQRKCCLDTVTHSLDSQWKCNKGCSDTPSKNHYSLFLISSHDFLALLGNNTVCEFFIIPSEHCKRYSTIKAIFLHFPLDLHLNENRLAHVSRDCRSLHGFRFTFKSGNIIHMRKVLQLKKKTAD